MVRPETHCPHTIRSAFSGRQGPRALSASACLTVTKAPEDVLRFTPRQRLRTILHPNCEVSNTATMFKATRALSMQPTRMLAMQPTRMAAMQPTRMMAMRQSPQLMMRQTMGLRNPVPVCLAAFHLLGT